MAAIHSYRSPKIEVSDNTLAGRGIVAVAPISKGEIVAIKAGHIVHREEVERLTQEIGDFSLQIHDDFYLTPRTAEEVEQTTVFINHSCDANVGFEGSVVYVAIRRLLWWCGHPAPKTVRRAPQPMHSEPTFARTVPAESDHRITGQTSVWQILPSPPVAARRAPARVESH